LATLRSTFALILGQPPWLASGDCGNLLLVSPGVREPVLKNFESHHCT